MTFSDGDKGPFKVLDENTLWLKLRKEYTYKLNEEKTEAILIRDPTIKMVVVNHGTQQLSNQGIDS